MVTPLIGQARARPADYLGLQSLAIVLPPRAAPACVRENASHPRATPMPKGAVFGH